MSKGGVFVNNLEFLEYTGFEEHSRKILDNGNIVVKGCFYGSEDLSYTEMEYIFDKNGDFIEDKEIEHYR